MAQSLGNRKVRIVQTYILAYKPDFNIFASVFNSVHKRRPFAKLRRLRLDSQFAAYYLRKMRTLQH